MAFPVTINGRTYTLADFEGTNYVDGFPDALEDFVTQAGDIYNSTSTSSVAIGTGSKSFTTADSGKPYQEGTPLRIADAAAPETNFMDCIVTSYSGTSLVVESIGFGGSGTKSSWTINIGGAKTVDGTLAINQGGTGATTAPAAASNLGLGTEDSPEFTGLTVTSSGDFSGATISDLGTVTTADINGGTIDGVTINDSAIGGSTPAAGSFTTLNTSGAVVFNEAGGDVDFRVEGDTDDNLLFVNAGADTVGIGGSTASKLGVTVSDSTAYTGAETGSSRFSIFNSDSTTNAFSSLSLQSGSSGQASATLNAIKTGASSTAFTIVTRGSGTYSEKFRIDSSGNVGIGVTPSVWSGLYKAQQINARAVLAGDSAQTVLANNWFVNSSGANTYIASAAATAFSQDDGVFKWLTAPSGTAGNAITFTERARIDSDGLKFNGDTAAANALDDYEEGTWTPVLEFGGGTTGITYTQQNGRYTKVGNLVHVQFVIFLSSKGSSTGVAKLTGLPFDPILADTSFYIYSDRLTFNNGVLTGYIGTGTTATLYNQVSGANSSLDHTAFASNGFFNAQFTFTVS